MKIKSFSFYSILLLMIISLLATSGCVPASVVYSGDRQIIVLWHTLHGAKAKALQAQSDQFNAEHGDEILLITEYQEDIQTKLAATTPEHQPDLVVVWPEDLEVYLRDDASQPDAGWASEIARADLLPMAEALYTVDGRLQALPLGLVTYLLYYNTDWMSDLGYDPQQATWQEFRRAACAATDPQVGHIGVGFPGRASILMAFLTSGGSPIVGDDGRYTFDDTAGIATVSVLNTLLNETCGAVYEPAGIGRQQLSNSGMAMLVESSLQLDEIEQTISEDRNFVLDVTTLPSPAGESTSLWYGPGLMSIAPEGARRAAAREALTWFYSPTAQMLWYEETRYLPVRAALIEELLINSPSLAQTALFDLALTAAEEGSWVAWPRYTNLLPCRAALLQGLLSLGSDLVPATYLEATVATCNEPFGAPSEMTP
ncbi:MAG: extracellular solute-binding protein [Chloroflexi bacterium]|jgi:ABC-type glycerol-3-phosphate transport system substrate-binding protein|nr:extracellular solute-binding protein [Chloroflexota bacterium]